MGMKDRVKGITMALRLDSHHAIERFGVFFLAIVASFALIAASASASSVANQAAALDSKTLYTPAFTTSRTQLAGDVAGVYVSSDRTRSMLLMHFKDTATVSTNAAKYQAFLSGSTRELSSQPLKSDLTGQIVVFGSTGYMAVVLDSDRPFEQQILNLTMRANSELVYRPEQARKLREDLAGQKSFTEFDQWRVYFNPGASGATVAKALDASEFDAGSVYAELVIAPQESEARSSLDEQLAQMQVDLSRIEEYESEAKRVNVDGVLIDLPEAPDSIAGDRITGKPSVGETSSTLELQTDWVSPRGFGFDWRSGSVEDGYLADVVPDGDSYVSWLAEKAALSKTDENGSLNANDIQWTLSNGRLLKDYSQNDTAMKPLFEIRNALSQAYQDYYQHKVKYQVDAYAALIELEIDLRNVRDGASENTAPDAFATY